MLRSRIYGNKIIRVHYWKLLLHPKARYLNLITLYFLLAFHFLWFFFIIMVCAHDVCVWGGGHMYGGQRTTFNMSVLLHAFCHLFSNIYMCLSIELSSLSVYGRLLFLLSHLLLTHCFQNLLSCFVMIAILIGMWWSFKVVLTCTSLMTMDVEQIA